MANIRSSRAIQLSLAVATLTVAVACSSEHPGTALPVTSGAAGSTPATSAGPATTATGGDSRLTSLDACSLLTGQEATTLFKAQGSGRNDETASSGATGNCKWTGRSANDSSTSLSISVRATQGLDQVDNDGGTITSGNVNGRPATKVARNTGGYCLISLATSPSSRVDLGYVIGASQDSTEVCQVDSQISSTVEPKLPAYQP
ncbi:MAG TPA: DUF3558 family protein [Amycolatopsis sp.]|nr:DUF3558 family protein [Amycolatopsis sp.]